MTMPERIKMKPCVECNICHEKGNGTWAGWHKKTTGHNDFCLLWEESDEPPPESNKNSFKLRVPRSWDLYSTIFGFQPLLEGNNNFRSLVALGGFRRNRILETCRKNTRRK